jgi:hypothetical protein
LQARLLGLVGQLDLLTELLECQRVGVATELHRLQHLAPRSRSAVNAG